MISLTVHSRRNRRGRTEVDIATKYYEEEKEKTKKILAKKKTQNSSKISKPTSSIINLPKQSQIEKKKKHIKPKKRSSAKKPSFRSRVRNTIKKPNRILRKNREGKKQISKQKRAKYFDRYNV